MERRMVLSAWGRAPLHKQTVKEAEIDLPEIAAGIKTLSNGLEIIVREDHSAPVVSLQAWCRAGSIHEDQWLGAGLSHLLEHMLFKGTSKLSANAIAQTVQDSGGYINAYTSFDRTVYWIDVPVFGYESCLDVLCQVVSDAALPEGELAKEQEVIRREFAMGDDDPDSVLSKMLFSTAFAETPYRHPVIGYRDAFDQVTRDDLVAYYQRYYVPNNLFFVVAGDVDTAKVHEQIEKHFAALPRRWRRPVFVPGEPRQFGRRDAHRDFATNLSRWKLAWHVPSLENADTPALDVLALILGDGRSSRLYRRLREERELVHGIGAAAYTPAHQGLFIISGQSDADKRQDAEAAAWDCVREVQESGVTPEELAKSIRQLLSDHFNTLCTMRGQASQLGGCWLLARNLEFSREYIAAVQKVTPEDVRRVARTYLILDGVTSVSVNPPQASNGGPAKTLPARDRGVERLVLPNGLTVLIQEDNRVPLVTLHSVFRGGLLAETPENNGITRLFARLLTRDTENRTSDEVAAAVESAGGGIGSSFGNNSFGVSVGVMEPDLALGLDILSDALLCPSFPPKSLERERVHQLASIRAEEDRPMTVAMKLLRRGLFGTHPYSLTTAGNETSVSGLSREQLLQFHGDFVCGQNGVLAVFGKVDAKEVRGLLEGRLAQLPEGRQTIVAGEGALSEPVGAGQTDFTETHNKEQVILLAGYRTCGLNHPDRLALDLLDEACSDMASRFFIRIREDLGLAYSVGASQLVGLHPGCFFFYVATSLEKAELAERELLDEIEQVATGGLTDSELARAKNTFAGKEAIHLQNARELAGVAALDELYGLGWNHHLNLPERIRAVESAEIKAAAAKYFTPENRVIVRLLPKG